FYETDKKARRVRVQRLPTAYLLPIVALTEIRHIPFKRQLGQNTLLLMAEKVNCRVSRPMFTLPKDEMGVGIAAAFDDDGRVLPSVRGRRLGKPRPISRERGAWPWVDVFPQGHAAIRSQLVQLGAAARADAKISPPGKRRPIIRHRA